MTFPIIQVQGVGVPGPAGGLIPTATQTANYTAAAGQLVPVDTTSAAVTVTLPSAPAAGTAIGVALVTQGGSNAVTVAASGTDHFSTPTGPTTLTVSGAGETVVVVYSGGVWYQQSSPSTSITLPVSIADGGTGQTTQQAALNALAGTVTSGDFLRGNGTNVQMAAIQSGDLPSIQGIPLAPLPAVTITTTGATFGPSISLVSGSTATVSWVQGGVVAATGLTPAINFGTAATRTVYMYVTDSTGRNALDQVTVFNIGYNSSNDPSPYAPSSSYNLTAQAVSGVSNIRAMTNLQFFLAEGISGLSGTLDFSGMSSLTNVELFHSYGVQEVLYSGCTSLQRLDIEELNLTSLDLNPVAPNLYDLRAAGQGDSGNAGYIYNAVTFVPQQVTLGQLYHFCVRDQVVLNPPDFSAQLPVVTQLWNWNSQQYGLLKVRSRSIQEITSDNNYYSGVDLTGQFPTWKTQDTSTYVGAPQLHMSVNKLTSVTLTGCNALTTIDLSTNPLSQSQVDSILATVDGWGTSNGTLNLGTTAAPSATGTTYVTALQGRGWTVTVDASGSPGGGQGTNFTLGESVIYHGQIDPVWATYPDHISVTLDLAVNSGDLLVAAIEAPGAPQVMDSSGNTWTVIGPLQSYGYLAYCLSAAASSSGLQIYAYGGNPHLLAVSRFVPHGVVSFGGSASSATNTNGLSGGANSLGDLGIVPLHALAWGAVISDSTVNHQVFLAGYQSGSSGTPDLICGTWQVAGGTVATMCVVDCANADAALTWSNSYGGQSAFGVSAYFTST